ncbi:MAG: DUF411 domain-containing protein [Sphingorhabdus sp.]
MRKIFLTLALVTTPALAASEAVMHRDPGCGCCEKWAAQVRKAFGRSVKVVDDANRPALQRRVGLPAGLASCHTALIDGIAFEGHVPIADMKRVLAAKPRGVRGLAVAGMPLGSPGMEAPGYPADRYNVIAFGSGKASVFAKH